MPLMSSSRYWLASTLAICARILSMPSSPSDTAVDRCCCAYDVRMAVMANCAAASPVMLNTTIATSTSTNVKPDSPRFGNRLTRLAATPESGASPAVRKLYSMSSSFTRCHPIIGSGRNSARNQTRCHKHELLYHDILPTFSQQHISQKTLPRLAFTCFCGYNADLAVHNTAIVVAHMTSNN